MEAAAAQPGPAPSPATEPATNPTQGPSRRASEAVEGQPLEGLWYHAMPARELKPGRMRGLTLLDRPILFGRDAAGKPFALRDICPHRGIPLSDGQFDGREVECAYHGWRFRPDGQCSAIPSLVAGQGENLCDGIKVAAYPLVERQGQLWIFLGRPGEATSPPPELPGIGERAPILIQAMDFPCPLDHAVVGLMDPAHGPYVHQSWFWRSRRSMHEKAKDFGPTELGFAMLRHPPSTNSLAYKILGGPVTTEISFRLPGIRVEHIEAGENHICGLTAVTPIDAGHTRVTHSIYATQGWLKLLAPLFKPFAWTFLNQDKRVVEKQQAGLAWQPSLMLIDDADTQAKWYYRLKRAWARSREADAPFENPVKPKTLRWRS